MRIVENILNNNSNIKNNNLTDGCYWCLIGKFSLIKQIPNLYENSTIM